MYLVIHSLKKTRRDKKQKNVHQKNKTKQVKLCTYNGKKLKHQNLIAKTKAETKKTIQFIK